MISRKSNLILDLASLITLIFAVALSSSVAERLIAAIWQWYKFSGYSNDGYITLSFDTGLFLSFLLTVIFGLGLWFNRIAKKRSASRARLLSFWTMCVSIAAALTYWLLGMSKLNAWRP